MPDPQPTIGELFKAKTVTDEAINGAVDGILAGEMPDVYPIAEGLVLDVAAAVKGHKDTAKRLADPEEKLGYKRTIARTAVILARPVKP